MDAAPPSHDLLFARDYPPMDGGIARFMAALAAGYPAGALTISTGLVDGWEASDAGAPQQIDRVAVPADRLRTIAGLLAWSRRAVSLVRTTDARFAWCDTIRPAGYVAHWAFRRTGLPYAIIVVGNDVLVLRSKIARSPFKRRLMRSILGRVAVIVAISDWTAAQCRVLLNELGLESGSDRIRVVPLGTDPDQWRADRSAAIEFRGRRHLPDGRWLVTVARLVEYKGIDTGIRCVAQLRHEFPELHYAVIGRGPHEAALRVLIAELGVADRVHLLTDVSDAELPAAYSLAQVYLGLTRETPLDVEGFGISFAEAAACGLPVIAARSGGIPDAVVDGVTGLLVNPEDPAEIMAAVRTLLDDATRARGMGAAGRKRVEEYLNWDRVVSEMLTIAEEFGRR